MLNKLLIIAGMASPLVLLATIIAFGFILPDFTQSSNYISELGARESPVQLPANIFAFLIPGILYLLYGIGLFRVLNDHWAGKVGGLFIILGGLSMLLITFFPCDPGCITTTQGGELHEFFSDNALYLAIVAFVFFALYFAKSKDFGMKWVYAAFGFTISTALFTYLYLELSHLVPFPHIVQRLAIATPFLFMLVTAIVIYKKKIQN